MHNKKMNNNPDETEVKNGVALIINNERFWNKSSRIEYKEKQRRGSKLDITKLSNVLEKFGFTVRPVIDCTEKEIKREVEKLAKEIMEKENYDLVLLVVMTHGDDGGTLKDKYLNVYNVKDIWDPFLPIKNIPKVFIRQTCRGGKYDMGQKVSTTQSQEMDSQRPNLESQTSTQECEGNLTPSRVSIIPNVHDVLVAYATIEDYYSWRHPLDGTYFITSFVKAVTENETNGKVELTGVVALFLPAVLVSTSASALTWKKRIFGLVNMKLSSVTMPSHRASELNSKLLS
ncbi:hypothetical protein B566_EDAN005088 [Ephemera danica]|nr:hypothetical protein B566_EDAN005088 [Ephemera danica]